MHNLRVGRRIQQQQRSMASARIALVAQHRTGRFARQIDHLRFVRDRFASQTVSLASSLLLYPVVSANGRYIAVLGVADLDGVPHNGAYSKVYIMPNPL